MTPTKLSVLLKVKFRQYPSIHTNYIISHCTTLQYNHNTWHGTYADTLWRRGGSAVECRTLDREDTVSNPTHLAPLMATRCGGVTVATKHNHCTIVTLQ